MNDWTAKAALAVLLAAMNDVYGQTSAETQMRGITVSNVEFRNAIIADVYDYVVAESGRAGRPINIVLRLSDDEKAMTVTLKMGAVSLLELLNAVSAASGVPVRFESGFVVVGSGSRGVDQRPAAMMVRAYRLPPHLVLEIRNAGARKFLSDLGVAFPGSASAAYNSASGKLVLVNTPDNVAVADRILRGIGAYAIAGD